MERWELQQQLRNWEAEFKQKCVLHKNKYKLKMAEFGKELEIATEEARKEVIQVQTEASREIGELKRLFHQEKLHLK